MANVASRWVLGRPAVAAVILGTTSDRHLGENRRLFELKLGGAELGELASFLDEHPGPAGDVYSLERRWEGPHARLLRTDLNRDG